MKIVNPWYNIPQNEPFVLPEDEKAIFNHNEKWKGKNYEIMLDVMPVPFSGDVFNSEIVILMSNPKYDKGTKAKEDKHYKEKLMSVFKHECKHFPFFGLDPNIQVGKGYWEPKLKQLLPFYKDWEGVSKIVSVIQYDPYSSKEFRHIKNLPSRDYTMHLVKKALERKAIIIVARSKKLWLELVDNLVDNFITLNVARNATISKGNCPKLFEILNNPDRVKG